MENHGSSNGLISSLERIAESVANCRLYRGKQKFRALNDLQWKICVSGLTIVYTMVDMLCAFGGHPKLAVYSIRRAWRHAKDPLERDIACLRPVLTRNVFLA